MPSSASLAAHLAAAPPVTGPISFVAQIEGWLQSAGAAFLGTPEARAAAKKTVMDVYDAISANMAKAQPMLGMMFGMFRPTVDRLVDSLLNHFSPVAVPAPAPVVPAVPQGSASP